VGEHRLCSMCRSPLPMLCLGTRSREPLVTSRSRGLAFDALGGALLAVGCGQNPLVGGLAARTRSQAEPWERGVRLHEQSLPARAIYMSLSRASMSHRWEPETGNDNIRLFRQALLLCCWEFLLLPGCRGRSDRLMPLLTGDSIRQLLGSEGAGQYY